MSVDQEARLRDAVNKVKTNGYEMKRCLDKNNVFDALKYAKEFLSELRTSDLSPKAYYELYMVVLDELNHFEICLNEVFKVKPIPQLYETVQYAGNIIPRLYLLITVGVVYIKNRIMSRKDVLKDLVEMCRGVQHPLRGLFLRNYLLQCAKSLLPDSLDEQDSLSSGTTEDSVDFVLLNFGEMNKLWVRMQHQGHTSQRDKREKERLELRLLVGTNLVRLSQLESMDVTYYSDNVLPNILEQVVLCRDAISQEYLMECIIQVFPDEFHIQTLNLFLQACADLDQHVNVKNILISLINRLAKYAAAESSSGIPDNVQLFDIFSQQISQVINSRDGMPAQDVVALETALINLAIQCYPDRVDYVDKVLSATVDIFKTLQNVKETPEVSRELVKLMKIPIDNYNSLLTVLKLNFFQPLMNYMDVESQKLVCTYIINDALDNDCQVLTAEQVEQVLKLLQPLLEEPASEGGKVDDGGKTDEEFEEEQNLVARLIHLFRAEGNNLDAQYLMLKTTAKRLANSGDRRLRFTFPSLVFESLTLCLRYYALRHDDEQWVKKVSKIFDMCNQLVAQLIRAERAELALRLYLQGVMTLSRMDDAAFNEKREKISYEYLTQAFTLYEEEVSDSKCQLLAIYQIIGTLERARCFSEENHEPLRVQCARAAAKLLRKPDQSRAVVAAAHLFWSAKPADGEAMRDAAKVRQMLDKSKQIALKWCSGNAVELQLLVELLDYCLCFRAKGCAIDKQFTDQLLHKIQDDLPSLPALPETDQISQHFKNVQAFMQSLD